LRIQGKREDTREITKQSPKPEFEVKLGTVQEERQ
jgi:hypothetical protein